MEDGLYEYQLRLSIFIFIYFLFCSKGRQHHKMDDAEFISIDSTFYAEDHTTQSGKEANNFSTPSRGLYDEDQETAIVIELQQTPLTPVANLLTKWGFSDFIDRFNDHGIEIDHLKLLNDNFLLYLLNGWPLSLILNFKKRLNEYVSFNKIINHIRYSLKLCLFSKQTIYFLAQINHQH